MPAPFRFGQHVIERDRFGSCPLIGWKAGDLEQVVNGAMQLLDPIVRLLQRRSHIELGVLRSLFLSRLQAQLKSGEWRTQLMGGIGREMALALQHVTELVDHRVMSFGDTADLGDAAGLGAYGEIPRRDPLGGFRQRLQGCAEVPRLAPRDEYGYTEGGAGQSDEVRARRAPPGSR